ncbi:MAG: carboxymuconolactone decarboxylase family protein [Dyella sp.]|uniref:carboxymuconolactone decarboxylase family protein n=1 Tax=Dyella sp. TaxID=1869338 RepID=UPI003F7D512E
MRRVLTTASLQAGEGLSHSGAARLTRISTCVRPTLKNVLLVSPPARADPPIDSLRSTAVSSKSYKQITHDLNQSIAKIRAEAPGTMAGFSAMSKSAMEAGALSAADKELIALAIGVATHCDGCIGFHTKALARLGVERAKLMETLAVAVYMGGGPSLMYAADAVRAYEEFTAAP